MRYSPMPWAPCARAFSASPGRSRLARVRMGWWSGVTDSQVRKQHQLLLPLANLDVALAVDLLFAFAGLHDHAAGAAIENDFIAIVDQRGEVTEADHRAG